MRLVIQRVNQAQLHISGELYSSIGAGMLVLIGIEHDDTQEDARWLAIKLTKLRIFADNESVMNLSLEDMGGEAMIVSQFTLHASTRKGNRPSYIRAARPEQAVPLYNFFISEVEKALGGKVATGKFGADMQISLINDGPVTIIMDSRLKE